MRVSRPSVVSIITCLITPYPDRGIFLRQWPEKYAALKNLASLDVLHHLVGGDISADISAPPGTVRPLVVLVSSLSGSSRVSCLGVRLALSRIRLLLRSFAPVGVTLGLW